MPSTYTLSGLIPVPGGTINAAVHVEYEWEVNAVEYEITAASWVDGEDIGHDELYQDFVDPTHGVMCLGDLVVEHLALHGTIGDEP